MLRSDGDGRKIFMQHPVGIMRNDQLCQERKPDQIPAHRCFYLNLIDHARFACPESQYRFCVVMSLRRRV